MAEAPSRFIFIINPNSGSQKLRNWDKLIEKVFKERNYEILYTRYAGHSRSILSQFNPSPDLCIVAVGGDGTVSDMIPSIMHIQCTLGIVPTGSGNGLARHLKIPIQPTGALLKLLYGRVQHMDVIQVNDQYCCNTCGIGYSAMVARNFGRDGKRGFWNYLKLAFMLHKESKSFSVCLNGIWYEDVWSLEMANSSQLGNNAIISPIASVSDGIMDVLLLKKPKLYHALELMFMVFSRNILNSRFSRFIRTDSLEVRLENTQDFHIDGDYQGQCTQLRLKVLPSSIKIIA